MTISQTPDRQCICNICENFRLLRLVFKYNNIKGIEPHTDLCIKQSMCNVDESNTESNSGEDGLHQVYPYCGYLQCIIRNCKECSTDGVLLNIVKENLGIMESSEKSVMG